VDTEAIHRAVSTDGTVIAGRVHGQGRPLVLVHGGLGDGELSWGALLPMLTDRFTCYTMSTRGRALSATPSPPDYSLGRIVDDVVAFVESIGEPVSLLGYSSGGMYALGAAARCPSVAAVAVYESPVFDATEQDAERFAAAASRMLALVAEGRLPDAAREILRPVAREEEMAALEAAGVFETWVRNIPVGIEEVRQFASGEGPNPIAPDQLARIHAPVLFMYGSLGHAWYREAARHLAEHVTGLRTVELEGVAHFAPLLAPEPIADALVPFLTTDHQPA
jgi:pimeloyl-ACP methyl ester carboxylesterase